jgi:sodium-coupled neutral amino acid transporter 9
LFSSLRLQNQTGQNLDLLNIPDHVVPPSFYQIHLPGLSTAGKQSSLVTIFAVWNTMMGTSLLSMPWALQQVTVIKGAGQRWNS